MAASFPPALKRLGQNFLVDPNIIRKIVSLAALPLSANGKLVLVNPNGVWLEDLTLTEATEAMNYINEMCDAEEANIYFGLVADPTMEGSVRITVLATGFNPYTTEGRKAAEMAGIRDVPSAPQSAVIEESADSEAPAAPRAPEALRPSQEAFTRVNTKDIWDKAAAKRDQAKEAADIFDEADLDIPAFLRQHKSGD